MRVQRMSRRNVVLLFFGHVGRPLTGPFSPQETFGIDDIIRFWTVLQRGPLRRG